MLSFNASQIRGLILDMDGVIWKMYHPLVDLPKIFDTISQSGLKVILATNNATESLTRYHERLAGFGVKLEPWQIINSTQATANYLKEKYPSGGLVHMVGENGLHQALEDAGFQVRVSESEVSDSEVSTSEVSNSEVSTSEVSNSEGEKPVGEVLAVVGSMDRDISYNKLAEAALLIRGGAHFVGTNPDKTFPSPYGQLPGAGTILAALEAASGVEPVIIGKPQSGMYNVALERLGTSPQETLVVGDRLETDIEGAQKMGCHTALVLSGVTSLEQAQAWHPKPDIIAQDLAAVLDIL